ncbi:hypothetical protein V5D56_16010 [Cellulosimicrobium sp. PMB13]|uniref:hypothetical protein n=1 Tax=Cellulosimicrobium sp. PMB13 TaxID=3120158 RepID=UPI003F4BC881
MTTEQPTTPDAEDGAVYPHRPASRPVGPPEPIVVVRPKPAAFFIALGFLGAVLATFLIGTGMQENSAGIYASNDGDGFLVVGMAIAIATLACLAVGVYRIVAAVDAIAAERYNSTLERR